MATQIITSNAGPKIKTRLPGPKAQKVLQGDAQYISPSYTRSYPLVAKRGRGVMIEDVDGNEFLDFSAGIAVVSTGHCHPEVVAAIQKQANKPAPKKTETTATPRLSTSSAGRSRKSAG